MKKNLLVVLAALSMMAAPVSALEWGGLVNNETKITNPSNMAFHQSNAVFLWVNAPLSENGAWAFSSEATYKYNFDVAGGTDTFGNVADCDLLKLAGTVKLAKGSFVINAGRFTFADITGANFSQCSDGVALNLNFPAFRIGAYAGYTGLLNSLNVTMLLSPNDVPKINDFYSLAHPYLPLMASFELPSILGNQSLAVQWESILDMGSEKYNRNYANISLSGPIAGTLYYSLISSLGIVDSDIMNYSSLTVSAYPNSSMGINAGVEYASGNQGPFKPYTTVTSKTAYNSALSPEMTGCLVPGADFTFTTGGMFVNVAVKAPFAMPDSDVSFKGIGGDLAFVYNIFSDLQAEVDVSAFKDIAGKGTEDNFSATLKFAISF